MTLPPLPPRIVLLTYSAAVLPMSLLSAPMCWVTSTSTLRSRVMTGIFLARARLAASVRPAAVFGVSSSTLTGREANSSTWVDWTASSPRASEMNVWATGLQFSATFLVLVRAPLVTAVGLREADDLRCRRLGSAGRAAAASSTTITAIAPSPRPFADGPSVVPPRGSTTRRVFRWTDRTAGSALDRPPRQGLTCLPPCPSCGAREERRRG